MAGNFSINLFLCVIMLCFMTTGVSSHLEPTIVSREEWNARPPKAIQKMTNPVPFVVIHHSYIPAACYNLTDCIKAMQWMQDFHQNNRSWADIGYSFAVGSDGRVYEGRGWSRVGAHAPSYNDKSIGICVIGDWREELPPEPQLNAVHQLIIKGVTEGYIMGDYNLVGHKQVREGTECPGSRLFSEINKWVNYCPDPSSVQIKNIKVTIEDKQVDDNRLKRKIK